MKPRKIHEGDAFGSMSEIIMTTRAPMKLIVSAIVLSAFTQINSLNPHKNPRRRVLLSLFQMGCGNQPPI